MLKIIKAQEDNIDTVVNLLEAMQQELEEFDFQKDTVKEVILSDIPKGVDWFLFQYGDVIIGTCHLQYLHNYWRKQKRYYLGGFYLLPEYRQKGYFKKIYALLKEWAKNNNGIQIYCHIYEGNDLSLGAFKSVGMKDEGYRLMIDHWD
ncbi:MAG: hypothetical protein COB76_01160 [Alphaproteobacteria bacterium]|nr:MAG: hypothetical protein COB76_01160 [Alphaproteobacteria bacterium]